jgi:RNA polymerase sigma factor (sigma-70 family)
MTRRLTAGRDDGAEVTPFVNPNGAQLPSALEQIYREKRPTLTSFLKFRLGVQGEAEDIAQAAFMQLWSRRHSLTHDNLTSLLFVTARNLATDALRRRRRAPFVSAGSSGEGAHFENVADDVPSAERAAIARRDLSLIQELLQELPPKCREAFVSYRLHNQDYAEIARRMRITESMVRKYVRRATVHCVARFSELEVWE